MKILIVLNLLLILIPLKVISSDSIRVVFSKIVGSVNYERYCTFFKSVYPEIECVNAYGMKITELDSLMRNSDALVLTGGPDVHPYYYKRLQDTIYCEVDNYRDSLEFKLIEFALEQKKPIFAICRGLQIFNVVLGGSLYPDIPTFFENAIAHRPNNGNFIFHPVVVERNSLLWEISKADTLIVNSFHHQGIWDLSTKLKPTAFAPDGLIEAIEWKDTTDKPFFIGVQWHPERLENNSTSIELVKAFVEAILSRKPAVIKN